MKNWLPYDAMKSSSMFCAPFGTVSLYNMGSFIAETYVWYMTLSKAISFVICGFGIREPAQNCQHKF